MGPFYAGLGLFLARRTLAGPSGVSQVKHFFLFLPVPGRYEFFTFNNINENTPDFAVLQGYIKPTVLLCKAPIGSLWP